MTFKVVMTLKNESGIFKPLNGTYSQTTAVRGAYLGDDSCCV